MHTVSLCYLVAYVTWFFSGLLTKITSGSMAMIGNAWPLVPILNVWLYLWQSTSHHGWETGQSLPGMYTSLSAILSSHFTGFDYKETAWFAAQYQVVDFTAAQTVMTGVFWQYAALFCLLAAYVLLQCSDDLHGESAQHIPFEMIAL